MVGRVAGRGSAPAPLEKDADGQATHFDVLSVSIRGKLDETRLQHWPERVSLERRII